MDAAAGKDRTHWSSPTDILGQPRGLYVLFLTEMWERFSFYGMRVLLIFYLTQHFLFDDATAILIVGSYNALVNASPLLGGLVADRYIGFKKAVLAGAVFMLAGHVGLAYEGTAAQALAHGIERDMFAVSVVYVSLSLLIVGVGLLKPSISSLVGELYEDGDPRRDSGFTIFTMGINLGATIAAVVCGYLGQRFGWAYGFGAAAIAMLLGLAVFLAGHRYVPSRPVRPASPGRGRLGGVLAAGREQATYIGAVLVAAVIAWLLHTPDLIAGILIGAAAGCAMYLTWYSRNRCTAVERRRTLGIVLILFLVVGYVILIEQVSTSLNLFVDRNVDRTVAGFTLQASQVYAVLPAMVIVFAPFFAWLWVAMSKRRGNPSVASKFAGGFLLMALAYLVLVYSSQFESDGGKAGLAWVVLFFVVMAMSDLLVVPIALSNVARLAAREVLGVMIGMYFFAISAANYLAAMVASLAAVPDGASGLDPAASMGPYLDLFLALSVASALIAVAVLALRPVMRRLVA